MLKHVLVAVAALSIVAAAFVGSAAGMTGGCSSGQIVKSGPYTFALRIGPSEEMHSAAEVKAKHPKSGEVMLSGTMTAMKMGGTSRHLEVHICNSSGAVVMRAHPTITVDDPMAKTMMMMSVPIATMEGVGMGSSDYHYGNNVDLAAGHHVTVTVALNGHHAVFHTSVPKTGGMSMNG